jgi:hypothetical protein
MAAKRARSRVADPFYVIERVMGAGSVGDEVPAQVHDESVLPRGSTVNVEQLAP